MAGNLKKSGIILVFYPTDSVTLQIKDEIKPKFAVLSSNQWWLSISNIIFDVALYSSIVKRLTFSQITVQFSFWFSIIFFEESEPSWRSNNAMLPEERMLHDDDIKLGIAQLQPNISQRHFTFTRSFSWWLKPGALVWSPWLQVLQELDIAGTSVTGGQRLAASKRRGSWE